MDGIEDQKSGGDGDKGEHEREDVVAEVDKDLADLRRWVREKEGEKSGDKKPESPRERIEREARKAREREKQEKREHQERQERQEREKREGQARAQEKERQRNEAKQKREVVRKEVDELPRRLADEAATEAGRAKLRAQALDASGRAVMNESDPRYKHMRLDYLYRDIPLTVNGKKTIYGTGRDGTTYYFVTDTARRRRATWKTGDIIKPFEEKEMPQVRLGITPREEAILRSYTKRYQEAEKRQTHNTFNRTYEHRLVDHELLLADIFSPSATPGLENMRHILFPHGKGKTAFIDIGPGIANKDLVTGRGRGKPAITLQEIAERFPDMTAIALDLPSEVKIFMGKTPRSIAGYEIDPQARREFFAHPNIHVISGDGLKSLKDQWEDTQTNPEPSRPRPNLDKDTTIFIRSANAIDIYCDWDREVRPALERVARDFRDQPVCYFFNRQILIKPAGATEWTIVGHVSPMGFRHQDRARTRSGEKPYTLDQRRLKDVSNWHTLPLVDARM